MKLKYEVSSDNIFNYLNESMFILSKRKIIENYNGFVPYNYFVKNLIMTCFYLLMLILFNFFVIYNNVNFNLFIIIWNLFASLGFISYCYILIYFLISYNMQKRSLKGELIIDNDTIIDSDDKGQVGFKLEYIKAVVVGKYCVMILFNDSPIGFRFSVSYSKKIISLIKKHKRDLKVINLYEKKRCH